MEKYCRLLGRSMSAIVPYSHYLNSLVQAELLRRHLYCIISPSSEPQEDPAGDWNRVTGNIIPSTHRQVPVFLFPTEFAFEICTSLF